MLAVSTHLNARASRGYYFIKYAYSGDRSATAESYQHIVVQPRSMQLSNRTQAIVPRSVTHPDPTTSIFVASRHPNPLLKGWLHHPPRTLTAQVINPSIPRQMALDIPITRDQNSLTTEFPATSIDNLTVLAWHSNNHST